MNRRGEIVARDGTLGDSALVAVDLVWNRLGKAPEATFALAACAGRLFALTGTPEQASLHWRVAAPDAPHRDCPVLFLRRKRKSLWTEEEPVGARALVGLLSESGDLALTNEYDIPEFDPESADIAAQASPTDVLFYRADGSAALYTVETTGFKTHARRLAAWDSGFSLWTSITYVRNGRLLFYNSNGTAIIGRFVDIHRSALRGGGVTKSLVQEWTGDMGAGWTHIVSSHDGVDGPYVLLYDTFRGTYGVGVVGQDGSYIPKVPKSSGMSTGWDTLVPAGQTFILLYNAASAGDAQPRDVALVEWANGSLREIWNSVTAPTDVDRRRLKLEASSFLVAGAGNGLMLRLREHQVELKVGVKEDEVTDHIAASFGVRADSSGRVDLRTDFGPVLGRRYGVPAGWRSVVALGGT